MPNRTNIDRLIVNAYALLFALIFVYVYQNILAITIPSAQLYARAGVSGVLYALAGCLVCMIPVVFALGPSEGRLSTGVVRLVWFQIGRLVMLFAYALAGECIFRHLKRWQSLNIMIAGIIMITYGAIILMRRWDSWKRPVKNSVYFLWGTSLGYGCSIEATAFLLPLWLAPDSLGGKTAAYLFFSLASVIFPMILLFPLMFIKKGNIRFLSVISEVGIRSSGMFLVIVGILMLGGLTR